MIKPTYITVFVILATTQSIIGLDATNNRDQSSKNHFAASQVTNKEINVKHRQRRSFDDEEEKPFWANRGKRSADINDGVDPNYARTIKFSPGTDESHLKFAENARHEAPFWGNRGRRDSGENIEDDTLIKGQRREVFDNRILRKILEKSREKNVCFNVKSLIDYDNKYIPNFLPENVLASKERREEEIINPFWGNRGRRSSEEESEENPFWGNRGRRDDDGPFWGARGRRDEDSPFWGARGRRDDDAPFWGTRGRREDDGPFWGARGRRENEVPFWGARGRRYDEDVTDDIMNALKNIKYELKSVSRSKRSAIDIISREGASFWQNRGRNSGLQLFNGKHRMKSDRSYQRVLGQKTPLEDLTTMKSLRQDRLYAEQPYYILVDRSSRSISGLDDDPYFITRGKKKVSRIEFANAARGRRGIIEQIARSVQDDPYFVVRGKKNDEEVKKNKKSRYEQLTKAKELICSAVVMMNSKKGERNKRELSDRDRNRRAILKKLAAQLQNDPYFVSRGKKSLDLDVDEGKLEEFVKQMNELCS